MDLDDTLLSETRDGKVLARHVAQNQKLFCLAAVIVSTSCGVRFAHLG